MAVLLPVITGVYDNYGQIQGRVGNGQDPSDPDSPLTDDNSPLIKGTGTPGSLVDVYGRDFIGTAPVEADSNWQLQVPINFPSGLEFFGAVYQDGQYQTNPYEITITRSLTPVITKIADQSGVTIPDHTQTNSTAPIIYGTAQPGKTIEIYDNGVKIGETQTASADNYAALRDGTGWLWSFQPAQPLDAATVHSFSAVSKNYFGEGTHSAYDYTIGIGVAAPLPDLLAPVITSVVDDAGANQGAVIDGGQTNDVRPTLHGTSEPGTVVTVSDNGHVIGTATTGADWQWSFTPNADLTAGTNTLSVSAARADGSGGSTAAWYTHVLDVTPSLDAVLATAGLSAAAAPAPTAQAAYASEAAHTAAMLPQHDLAY